MEDFKNQKSLANVDKNLQAVGQPGVFIGGDAITPLLLTTAIGHARIAAEGIDDYVMGREVAKRPKVDKKLFDMPVNMTKFGAKFDKLPDGYTRATQDNKNAVHNFDDRADRAVIDAKDLFLGHFVHTPRTERDQKTIEPDPLARRETLELVRAYYKIADPRVRKRLFELTKSLANAAVSDD